MCIRDSPGVDQREYEVAVEAGPPPAPEKDQAGDLQHRHAGAEAPDPGRPRRQLAHLAREGEGERLEIYQAGEGAGHGEEDRDRTPGAWCCPRGGFRHFGPPGFDSVRLRCTKLTKTSGPMKPFPQVASHCAEGLAAMIWSSVLPWATRAFTRSRIEASTFR